MRIVTVADKDYYPIPKDAGNPDLVFFLGDVSDDWIKRRVEALEPKFGAFGIRGNHDPRTPFPKPVIGLNFEVATLALTGDKKLTLAGIPGSWRYKPAGNWMFSQDEMAAQLEGMPPIDILLCHNSPANIGHERPGESLEENPHGIHQGFLAITDCIERLKPKVVFHGHQHLQKKTQLDGTLTVGCYGEEKTEIAV